MMMLKSVTSVAIFGFLSVVADAFVVPHSTTTKSSNSKLFDIPLNAAEIQRQSLYGLEFQLEEREDRDTEATNIWLNKDGSVTLGQTDGPLFTSYKGSWSILETCSEVDKPFRLKLDRIYEGNSHAAAGENKPGEFEYHVKREFYGNINNNIGCDTIEIEGIIHALDERDQIDCEVGYFALIDTSKELTDDKRELEAEISNTLRLDWIKESNNNQKKSKKHLVRSSNRQRIVHNHDLIQQGPFY